eukprot:TRINITY_DN12216_c0_g1_i2.p1 TRINITY_DN12216_c0_g1~~TRINITY_DN12216_c0_g1_i2.p1  ORF type:complete len:367 (-),score=78.37 TRINITY_DN12216_c0_g1_i2:99-1199(-)
MGLLNSKLQKGSSVELKYCNLNGIYPTCTWENKIIKKWIIEKKVAPLYPGQEEKTNRELDECPICFLYYPGGLNRSKCCNKEICTECFLQYKKPNTTLDQSICPFCNRNKFIVVFTGPKPESERLNEEREEQKVIDLQNKMRQHEIEQDVKREQERQKEIADKQLKSSEVRDGNSAKEKGKEKVDSKSKKNKKSTASVGSSSMILKRKDSSGRRAIVSSSTNLVLTPKQKEKNSDRKKVKHKGSSKDRKGSSVIAKELERRNSKHGSSPEQDLEEIMIMEAIRLSLIETSQKETAPKEELSEESSDSDVSEEGSSSIERTRNLLFSSSDTEENETPLVVTRGRRTSSSAKTPPMQRVNINETPLGS